MSERMEGPEKRGHRNSPEREASRVRVEPEPVLPTSALIINEMEQHYFRPGLPTSEYAAVRDCATLLNAANYVILRGSDDFSNNRFNDSGKLVNSRREAGVYGENGETLKEAGSYAERLGDAFLFEKAGQPLINNLRVVFSRIRDRLENPTNQPLQDLSPKTPPQK